VRPYVLLYLASTLFSTVVAATLAVHVVRRADKRGANWFAVALFGIAIWTATETLSVFDTTPDGSLLWLKLTFVGSAVAGVGLFLFVLVYTGRSDLVTAPRVALLSLEPLVAVGLVLLGHPLIFRSSELDTTTGHFIHVTHGQGFFVHLLYMSLLLAATTALLAQLAARARNLYRWQAVAILLALGLPWAGTVVDGVFAPTVGLAEPLFVVSVVALWVGLFRYELVEVPPVAPARVVETLSEGVLVVNDQNLLVDLNPAAQRLLDVDDTVVGEPVAEVFADQSALLSAILADEEPTEPVPVEQADGTHHVEVESASLGRRTGEVFLLEQVTERIQRERELERQNERLDQFAGVVSHDLRNPLNVAAGYVDLLDDHVDDQEATAYIEEVQTSHDRMGRIVDDVLALAREGESVEDPDPVPLGDVAGDAWAQVDTADAVLVRDIDRTVHGDRGQLQRSFENLFRNAVEHGGRDVTVTVGRLDDGNGDDGFFVADDGPGIPAEDRPAVFDRGFTTSDEGTGYGLAIVTEIADAHGWSVTVGESDLGGARLDVEVRDDDGEP